MVRYFVLQCLGELVTATQRGVKVNSTSIEQLSLLESNLAVLYTLAAQGQVSASMNALLLGFASDCDRQAHRLKEASQKLPKSRLQRQTEIKNEKLFKLAFAIYEAAAEKEEQEVQMTQTETADLSDKLVHFEQALIEKNMQMHSALKKGADRKAVAGTAKTIELRDLFAKLILDGESRIKLLISALEAEKARPISFEVFLEVPAVHTEP
jgi:hypothetical protein